MVEILMGIPIGEQVKKRLDEGFKYDTFISTKTRLKRNGQGEWSSDLKNGEVTITRIA